MLKKQQFLGILVSSLALFSCNVHEDEDTFFRENKTSNESALTKRVGTHITPLGSKSAQLDLQQRVAIANDLLSGNKDIILYNTGICHDVVGYVKYMLGSAITPTELTSLSGQSWLQKFNYPSGKKWDGSSDLPKGKAIGFYRVIDKVWFHSAISTGKGSEIRAVNGGLLGAGWSVPVNLKSVLKNKNADGTFNYDNTKIEVYISSL